MSSVGDPEFSAGDPVFPAGDEEDLVSPEKIDFLSMESPRRMSGRRLRLRRRSAGNAAPRTAVVRRAGGQRMSGG
ncbi:hypothetical protein Pen02_64610 [Plantactinospora endophytica]|uniref:Uncharacterized protein n=1 Tax=Plantactinospora endophytica TaxID=673535 RepID=A0ABQ4E9X0_9ACTN|nr:hypothetical protein Pen02_64610 [Plantactinospora endophytica]